METIAKSYDVPRQVGFDGNRPYETPVDRSTIQDIFDGDHRLAFMFPGVGAQYSGMGRYVYDQFSCARDVFDQASAYAGQDVAKLCFSPDASNRLGELGNATLAVVTTSLASSTVLLEEFGIVPDYCAGHSAGEYSALCFSGILSLEDTVALILERAAIVDSVASAVGGRMAWVLNLNCSVVENLVASLRQAGHQVYISAYDSPDQTSVSVGAASFESCADAVEEAGGILLPINYSGPYHSPLMEAAKNRFREVLEKYAYRSPLYEVISNRSANPYSEDRKNTLDNLSEHLVKPVQWRAIVQHLLERGVRYAIEPGPKNVLGFLLNKTTTRISSLSLDKEKDWMTLGSDWLIREADVARIIGRVLGVIASTRNECDDASTYRRSVVEPTAELASFLQDLKAGKASLSKANLHRIVDTAGSILSAKRLPASEVASRFADIFGPKLVHLRYGGWS